MSAIFFIYFIDEFQHCDNISEGKKLFIDQIRNSHLRQAHYSKKNIFPLW